MGTPQKKAPTLRKSRRTTASEVQPTAERPVIQLVRDESEQTESVQTERPRRRLDYSLKGLIGLIREVKSVLEALETIWGANKENQKLLRSLISFAERIGISAKQRVGINSETLRRTVNFANRVREALETEFRQTVEGWEARHDATFAQIRAVDPSILDEFADRIAGIQSELRRAIAAEAFMPIALTYRQALNLIGKMRKQAQLAEEENRRAERAAEQAEQANELFSEIDELKALLD